MPKSSIGRQWLTLVGTVPINQIQSSLYGVSGNSPHMTHGLDTKTESIDLLPTSNIYISIDVSIKNSISIQYYYNNNNI